MLPQSIGEKLRKLRLEKKLPLRKVAAVIEVDVAILSKMERGERRLNREIVKKLATLYEYNPEELLVLYLSDKVLYEIGDDALALKALQVAEEQVMYQSSLKIDRKELIRKLKIVLSAFTAIEKAWIYGSFARKDDGPRSDIDVALKTDQTFSYFDLAEVQYRAEQVLKRKVDIGFIDAFKPHILESMRPDLKLVYEKK